MALDDRPHVHEGVGAFGVKLAARAAFDLGQGFIDGQAGAIRPVGGHRVEGIDYGHEARQERDLVLRQLIGVTVAVPAFDGLAIWHDANGNGICEPGEIHPLSDYGIVAISCEYRTDSQHPDRIVFSPRGVMFRDGATRPTYDLILRHR
jgi:hypothetical protein